jgi:hypothetical protein
MTASKKPKLPKTPVVKAAPKAPPAHATATIRVTGSSDKALIALERALLAKMKASSRWPNAPTVQSTATAWSTTNEALDANATVVSGLALQLAAANAKQRTLRIQWEAGRKLVCGAVTVDCAGVATDVEGYGLTVLTHSAGAGIVVPSNIVTLPGENPGEASAVFDATPDKHGYMGQTCTDPTNGATFSAPFPCPYDYFTQTGLASGAVTHFRFAAVDPSLPGNMTAWSPWAAGTAK